MTINGHPYEGELGALDIFRAICNSYDYRRVPFGCHADFQLAMAVEESEKTFIREEPSGLGVWSALAIILLVVVVNLCAISACYKRQ